MKGIHQRQPTDYSSFTIINLGRVYNCHANCSVVIYFIVILMCDKLKCRHTCVLKWAPISRSKVIGLINQIESHDSQNFPPINEILRRLKLVWRTS